MTTDNPEGAPGDRHPARATARRTADAGVVGWMPKDVWRRGRQRRYTRRMVTARTWA
ncbi:hypothetical protein [Roseiflexus sp.]|uniref:hypothetical protein n=1 Tax=Roseiflexus sp. TaxID=2562120 RepID=UPI002586891A|nr:hypothetical protein [Roseiflexus sp.]